MLEVRGLSFQYSHQSLLRDVTFSLSRGSSVAILGPSGCGKTTLFRLLTGLLPAQEGSIFIDGIDPSYAQGKISYMMQKDLLLPWKTVIENVCLPAKLSGFSKKESQERALLLLTMMNLGPYIHYYPHELSGGMRQKAALARALLLERPYLFLDEPFCAIDEKQKNELHKLLEHKKEDRTLLLITHDLFEAYSLCDKVLFLSDGRLLNGASKEEFKQAFLSRGL